jgi:hypothetical protein
LRPKKVWSTDEISERGDLSDAVAAVSRGSTREDSRHGQAELNVQVHKESGKKQPRESF